MSICSLGLMGAEYVRDSEVPQIVELVENADKIILIENVHSV